MNLFVECLVVNLLLVYYMLESFVLLFVPTSWRHHKNVKGQTVLITGAGSGIGRLMAHRFAKLGCKLVLWDINGDGNERTAAEVREFGATAYTFVCDVSKREDVYKAANEVKTKVGDMDILINNAGIVTGKKLLECPDDLMQKTMDVNINAHFWTTKAFLPAMLSKNRGHVVTIASIAGVIGINCLVDYCASKFAAIGFDESLRSELYVQGKTGVHTTVACPCCINTGMFEGAKTRFPSLLPIMNPDYVADRILDAILTNQQMLIVPRSATLIVCLKNLLPIKALGVVNDFFGISHYLDEFKGRAKYN